MTNDVLHGESGQPIQFGPLSQTIVHSKWTLWIVKLRPEKLFHFTIFFISKVFGRISSTRCQIQLGILHTPHPVQRSKLWIAKFPSQHKGLSSRNLFGLT